VRRSRTAPSSCLPDFARRAHYLPAAVRCRTRGGPQRVAVFTAAVSAAAATLGYQTLRPSYRDPRLATSGATPRPRLQGTKKKKRPTALEGLRKGRKGTRTRQPPPTLSGHAPARRPPSPATRAENPVAPSFAVLPPLLTLGFVTTPRKHHIASYRSAHHFSLVSRRVASPRCTCHRHPCAIPCIRCSR
jgi:hypothetical protein